MSKSDVPYVSGRNTKKSGIIWDVKLPTKVVDALRKSHPELKDYYQFKSRLEAEDYAKEIRSKYRSGKDTVLPVMRIEENTIGGLVMRYKQSDWYRQLAASSKRSYSYHLNHSLPMKIGNGKVQLQDMPWANFKRKDAKAFHASIVKADKGKTHKARHTMTVFRRAWECAIDDELTEANPFSKMGLKEEPYRHVLWEIDQINEMVKFCDDNGRTSVGTLIKMNFELCQRIGDMRQLKWRNIMEGRANFKQEKTGAKMSIGLSKELKARLDLHSRRNDSPFIIHNENTKQPYTADRIVRVFDDLRKAFNVPSTICLNTQKETVLWINDLRTTGITHAMRAGATDRQLMALSGHKDPKMLIRYAVHGNIEADAAQGLRGLG